MTASNDTVNEILIIFKKHVDDATLKLIIQDLLEVKGNRSFVETIKKINEKLDEK